MISASQGTLKKCSPTINLKYTTPWWNENCEEAVRKKHGARNLLKKYPTVANLINFKKLQAIAKKIILQAKRQSFRQYCSTINSDTPVSQIWKRIASMQKKNKPKNSKPLFTIDQNICMDPQKKSNLLAETFENTFNSDKIP